MRLHSQGITTFRTVAKEAGVSLPTVEKHFPTRDDLFRACTTRGRAIMPPPSINDLTQITDPAERLNEIVRQIYVFYEAKLGVTWTSYKLEDESPILAEFLAGIDTMVSQATEVIIRDWKINASPTETQTMSGLVRGLLSPLTYRALRLKGQLTLHQAIEQVTLALSKMLSIGSSSV